MQYIDFEWDEWNEFKVTRRASLEEIESTFYDSKKIILTTYFNRYKLLARTRSGRYLIVIFQRKAGGIIRVISVRDMIRSEFRFYRRK